MRKTRMSDHGSRDHAQWSASASARHWACPGSMALTMDIPGDTNRAADWGTACHQISERCLRDGTDASDYAGTTEKGKEYSFEVDDEMVETAQAYIDFVRANAGDPANLHIEQKFSLDSLNPPFQAGGTADAVIWKPEERLLHVIDLKTGMRTRVEVEGNVQLRTYALGAMLANPQWKPERIRVTVVQTRASHPAGRIRHEDFHVVDLLEWTTDLMAAMYRARDALVAKGWMIGEDGQELSPGEWAATYLKPGDHCTFCKAAGFCPALEKRALDQAGVWFTDEGEPQLANTPHPTDPDERRNRLDALDLIETYVKAVRAWEHNQSEGGDLPTDYILVESFGREKFKDESAVIAKLRAAQVPDTLYLNPAKARTPKQIRDGLAKTKHGLIDKLPLLDDTTTTPSNGRTLVRADKTTRAAAAPRLDTFLETPDTLFE